MTIINLSIWGWKKKIIYGQYLWNAMIIKWRKKEKHLEEMLSFWCKSWHGMNHGIWNKICNYALNFFSYVLGIDRFIIKITLLIFKVIGKKNFCASSAGVVGNEDTKGGNFELQQCFKEIWILAPFLHHWQLQLLFQIPNAGVR